MKIAICDDEPIFQKKFKTMLDDYYRSIDVLIVSYSSGAKLIEEADRRFDLVFLDIEMEGMDGLETAKHLHCIDANIPIIFLTSHTELAMEGYEVQAFRFLAKPVDENKLKEALLAFEKSIQKEKKIVITEDGVNRYIFCADIRYIKSESVYLSIMTKRASHLIRKSLKEQLEELPKDSFIQVHRSYIVNLNEVTGFNGDKVIMKDGSRIPVSRSKRESFKQQMMRFMKSW